MSSKQGELDLDIWILKAKIWIGAYWIIYKYLDLQRIQFDFEQHCHDESLTGLLTF